VYKTRVKHIIFFSICWIWISYASGVYKHLSGLPSGVHQSAQCDRASLAQNYYYGGLNFLFPEVNEDRCTDGIVSCEMPLTSYLAACLYKLFSYDEFYFRLLSYLFFSGGMMALFFLFKSRMGILPSILLIFILQGSPILLFYSTNFLPDISSLGLGLIAWFLFFGLFIKHPYLPFLKKKTPYILFIICLSLSISVKTTSLIQWFTMAVIGSMSFIPIFKIEIERKKHLLIALLISLTLPLLWYFWSRYLGSHHNSQYFMMHLPSSESWQSYSEAWAVYLANWPSQTLSFPLFQISLGIFLLTVFLKKFIQTELWWIFIINSIGTFAFLFLMIEQFKYHDYYVICLFPFFALTWLALSDAVKKIKAKLWWFKLTLFAGILIAFNYQFNTGKKNLEERYTKGNYWEQSHHSAEDFDSLRLKLEQIGITRNSCVVAGYDPAPNNMLYLLHLRGHRFSKDHDTERMHHILYGSYPKYLISNDSAFTQHIKSVVDSISLRTTYKNLEVYQLYYPQN
jgi:hypothetical protein